MKIQSFDFSVNVLQALLWQYNKAVNLEGILTAKQAWYDEQQTEFWNDWYTNVFNLVTANEFGLSLWAIILGLPITVGVPPDSPDKPAFAYDENRQNYEHGNYTDTDGGIILTLEEKRLLLRLRYFQLACRAATPQINEFFVEVFKNFGTVYVLDGVEIATVMTITIVFLFPVSARLRFLLEKYDVIPRGAGVKLNWVERLDGNFGYGEFNQNYENGNYEHEDTI